MTQPADVPKESEELVKLKGDNQRMKEELEDLRMETVSPEYLEFLASKDRGAAPPKKEELDKLTPAQIYEKAAKEAEAKVHEGFKQRDEAAAADRKAATDAKVREFAASHGDFEKFRPIMFGLTLEDNFKTATLDTLYKEAKDRVKALAIDPTKEEKKGRKGGADGEKPGGSSSSSYDRNKKYTPTEAAEESWAEVVGKGSLEDE